MNVPQLMLHHRLYILQWTDETEIDTRQDRRERKRTTTLSVTGREKDKQNENISCLKSMGMETFEDYKTMMMRMVRFRVGRV